MQSTVCYEMTFVYKLQGFLGNILECFEGLGSFERASFVLDSELWLLGDDFSTMLILLKRKAREVSKFHSPSLRMFISEMLEIVDRWW